VQHGLLDSSYTWVNQFQNESLAYILGEARAATPGVELPSVEVAVPPV
jgi:hypothetical protein